MGSENGWEPPTLPANSNLLEWKTIPGRPDVSIQVMKGLPEVFLPAWAADWQDNIEVLRDDDTACYTPTNSVATSNHLNGTAIDIDWDNHPFQELSFSAAQLTEIHAMVDFYEGWVYWAGDWDSPIDQMHSQMGYNTWNRNTDALDFISRKIRSDGKSTYKRGPLSSQDPPNQGGTAANPPVSDDGVDTATKVLYDAVPVIDMDTAAKLVPLILPALVLADCDNVKRIAMWLAQIGEESGGFVYTEEINKVGAYAPYIGRTWIQITWQSNYAAFGAWCVSQGLIDDANQFVNNPQSLADPQWAGIGPAWYWTVARPTINSLCDNGDIVGVTQLINGGQNGIQDRTNRYQQAIALGDRLLLLISQTDDNDGDEPVGDIPTKADFDRLEQKVDQLLAQSLGQWPQNGNDAGAAADLDKRKTSGDKLTPNDILCWLKNHTSTHAKPTP